MLHLQPGDDLRTNLDKAAPGETVLLAPGTYRAKISISVPGLKLFGSGADRTRIVWGDYAKKTDSQGREYNTFRTWTAAVLADGVTKKHLAVINDSGHPEINGQEVALTVYADSFLMERCRLSSTQDTLFLGPLPGDLIDRYDGFLPDALRVDKRCSQRFSKCLIEGNVDFIFGCGEALFEDCELRSVPDGRGAGYVAAPAHAPEQTRGFHFRNCRFTAAEGVAENSVYLARPWRDYGLCLFENCAYGPHIPPTGFDRWNDSERDKTARFYETPSVPGRVPWVRTL